MLNTGLQVDAILADARQKAGIDDFGDMSFVAPLQRYVELVLSEPDAPGATSFMPEGVVNWLVNRLRYASDLREYPEIADEDVSDPIIILGFPRTGTTLLQRMLSADPANQSLTLWKALNPAPFPGERGGPPTERIAVARQTEMFYREHNPEFFAAHAFIAEDAEEDFLLHFLTLQHVGQIFNTPPSTTYLDYLRSLPRNQTYEYVAGLLRYLQWQDGGRKGRRWILKSPLHLGCVKEMLACHPRATFIYAYRDLATVIGSYCYAYSKSVGRIFGVSNERVGALALDFWSTELKRFRDAQRDLSDRLRLMEVPYTRLVTDPIAFAREAYDFAGARLDERGERAMRAWLDANPAGKHGTYGYKLDDFGLTPKILEDVFGSAEASGAFGDITAKEPS